MPSLFHRFLLTFFALLLSTTLGTGCDKAPQPWERGPDKTSTSEGSENTAATTPTSRRALPKGKEVGGKALRVPFILWGGDMATFFGNGGLRTLEGSIFDE